MNLELCLTLCTTLAAAPDPAQLLRRSDQARGGGLPGLVWEVRSRNSGGTSNVYSLDTQYTDGALTGSPRARARIQTAAAELDLGRNLLCAVLDAQPNFPALGGFSLFGSSGLGDGDAPRRKCIDERTCR